MASILCRIGLPISLNSESFLRILKLSFVYKAGITIDWYTKIKFARELSVWTSEANFVQIRLVVFETKNRGGSETEDRHVRFET
jgi:hypothetical protein